MTATLPTRRTVSLLREYRLYRFFDDHGRLLYVGMTGRQSLERLVEHLKTKWWAGDIACWERDPRVWRDEQACLAAERAAIITERPVHNVAHNGNNPGPVAVRVAPRRVAPRQASAWHRFWVSPWGARLADRLKAAGTVAAVWVALVVTGTVALTYLLNVAPDGAATVAGITTTLGMAKWWPRRKPRRRRR